MKSHSVQSLLALAFFVGVIGIWFYCGWLWAAHGDRESGFYFVLPVLCVLMICIPWKKLWD